MLGAAVGNRARTYPPTPAMKRFADSLARKKGIKPPPGYKASISICGAFLKEHAPKKAEGKTTEKLEPKPVSPAQMLYAKKIAQEKGLVISDEAKANSAAMSAWIDSNRDTKRSKRGRNSLTFVPSHWRLPHVGSRVAFPSSEVLREIAGHNIEGAPIGHLAFGEYIYYGNPAGRDARLSRRLWNTT